MQKTVPQHQLPRRDRACVIQCGTLATIIEEPAPILVLKRMASDEAETSMTASVASDDDDEADPRYAPALKRKTSWTAKAHRVLSVKRLSKSQLLPRCRVMAPASRIVRVCVAYVNAVVNCSL